MVATLVGAMLHITRVSAASVGATDAASCPVSPGVSASVPGVTVTDVTFTVSGSFLQPAHATTAAKSAIAILLTILLFIAPEDLGLLKKNY
jgi:hypothetical protein